MATLTTISTGPLTFNCHTAGTEDGELVILLHGFPEASIMWTALMDSLAARGFHCIAPDMRGYSPDACPKGKKHYSLEQLVQDVLDIAGTTGKESFHLIGHDWGAAIGWKLVYENPEKILSWTALAIPHSAAFKKALQQDPVQKKKSRYIGYFLIPYLPELVLKSKDFKRFRRLWKYSPPEDVAYYLKIFKRKGALTAALNYYRANIRRGKQLAPGKVSTPTLFIWGNRDLAVGRYAAETCADYVTGPFTYLELDAGHWLIQSKYKEVEQAVLDHLNT